MVLVVGSLSFIYPEIIGRTVWGRFGADYGYFPLFQPLLGLIWLFSLPVLRAYGIMGGKAEEKSATNFNAKITAIISCRLTAIGGRLRPPCNPLVGPVTVTCAPGLVDGVDFR
jgi:hypothetical protein